MRILVLNYEFPPIGGGGGRASAALCRELATRGHELIVLSSRGPGLAAEETIDGYHVRRVFTGRRSRFQASFTSMAGYVLAGFLPGLSLIRSWKPDVIHVHFAVPTGALGHWLSRLAGVPYVLTAHLGDVPGGVPEKTDRWFRLVDRLTPSIWEGASAVVAVSEHTRRLAEKRYGVPVSVIPNGMQLPRADELQIDVGDPPVLIFAGRFQPQKNLPALIEALADVRELAWQCVLMGDGPQRKQVSRQIDRRELGDRVALDGWVTPEQVERQLRRSDLLCMPSLAEGLPVVGIQALAYGLAIVASRAGGLSDLVEDGVNGRLCEVGDPECLVEGLRWCLEDRARLGKLKAASRARARPYDVRLVGDAYESLLREACAA